MSPVVVLSVLAALILDRLIIYLWTSARIWWLRRHLRAIEREWDELSRKINMRGVEGRVS